MLKCPVCDGYGENGEESDNYCKYCDNGRFEIVGCPKDYVTADIWEAIEYAELFEKGLPPVKGGILDQTASFAEAARFIWLEENRIRRKLGIF